MGTLAPQVGTNRSLLFDQLLDKLHILHVVACALRIGASSCSIWRELGPPVSLAVDSGSVLPRTVDPRVTILVSPDIMNRNSGISFGLTRFQ